MGVITETLREGGDFMAVYGRSFVRAANRILSGTTGGGGG